MHDHDGDWVEVQGEMISKNGTTYCIVVTVFARAEGYIKKEYLVFDDAETVVLDDAETDSFSKCGENVGISWMTVVSACARFKASLRGFVLVFTLSTTCTIQTRAHFVCYIARVCVVLAYMLKLRSRWDVLCVISIYLCLIVDLYRIVSLTIAILN